MKKDNNSEQTVNKGKRKMDLLFKRVPGAGHSQPVLDILSRAHHVELAKNWGDCNLKALRHEISAMKANLDAVMCFVKAYENSADEEIPICVGDIRARALVLLDESGKLLRSFRIPENLLKEKIAWLSFEYKQLKIDVEGLCLMAEGEPSAEAVETAL